ncbi:hypothetical protein L6164_030379 [Bauhinia variegata]|uniref:Uncharacterized protein n=1 Tax=Bauhinia variegata TaxID=167791 RepID=A0ACB9LCG5_BAUVA|nr:hypothetical protein L6164_030379 [Bauhinia variegata]
MKKVEEPEEFKLKGSIEFDRISGGGAEVEKELVTGYQIEYSGIKFGLFYVASYLNLLISLLFVTVLYFGRLEYLSSLHIRL